ncbi:MAG TPA: hypothetical protein VFV69_11645 [Steroidobacteraceae bacterium]|nr:hypothetical protein [Steroidobacteraceae bacterium]
MAHHIFAAARRLARTELRQPEIDLDGGHFVERQGFHQCVLASRRTEPVPQQDRRLCDLRRHAQQRGHRRQPRLEDRRFAGFVTRLTQGLDLGSVLRSCAHGEQDDE